MCVNIKGYYYYLTTPGENNGHDHVLASLADLLQNEGEILMLKKATTITALYH